MVLTHSVSHKAKMIFTLTTKPWSRKSLSNISPWRICEQSFVPLYLASFLLLINALTVKNLFLLTELCTCSSFLSFFARKFCRRLPSVVLVCTWRQLYTQCSQTEITINLRLCDLIFKRQSETEMSILLSYLISSFHPYHPINTDIVYRIKASSNQPMKQEIIKQRNRHSDDFW